MDFGDFITLILFLVFVVSPFLKRKKAKKAGNQDKAKQSGFSILGKISDALKEAAREMEAQAEQARKKEAADQNAAHGEALEDQTFWDEVDDREEVDFDSEGEAPWLQEHREPVHAAPVFASPSEASHEIASRTTDTRDSKPETLKSFGHDTLQTNCPKPGQRRLPAHARGLQKAVIWSEILGKPVALKD